MPMRLAAVTAALVVLAVAPARADEVQLNEPVADRYTVKKGDTLWGIAGRFLKDPWRWPDIWRLNRDEIKNPHRIYPGDVILLDKSDGQWRLRVESSSVRLSPSVRTSRLDADAIPSVPPSEIEPFLTRPLITGPDGLADAPEIIAGRDPRVVRGVNDTVYVTGLDPSRGTLWYIYRKGRTLHPIESDAFLGEEQRFVGTGKVERFADVSTVRIAASKEEILVGDKFVPAPPEQLINYAPHAPQTDVNGRIIALGSDSVEVGRGSIVTIDKGSKNGIDIGAVLAIYRVVPPIQDPRPSKEPDRIRQLLEQTKVYQPERLVKVPDERTGLVFVFRVFDFVSYAIVLNTTDPVTLG
ncbi:MAG: LysM peptidoglycan-binding domain-containing protein, partial [Aromatoleum sp.]|nr:LysM peptidoglycan-binding domain-containing protein [Aromatoleum sp.]